jgi:hypothetical protein
MITAKEARNNYSLNSKVLKEVHLIEEQILIKSNSGVNQLLVNFTPVTDNNIPEFKTIENITDNILTVTDHGYETGDTVEIDLVEYMVTYLTDDTFSIDGIVTGIQVKKVIDSEKYYKAWTTYYVYPNAISYLNVLSDVEKHFRNGGFSITRKANLSTKTIEWSIAW